MRMASRISAKLRRLLPHLESGPGEWSWRPKRWLCRARRQSGASLLRDVAGNHPQDWGIAARGEVAGRPASVGRVAGASNFPSIIRDLHSRWNVWWNPTCAAILNPRYAGPAEHAETGGGIGQAVWLWSVMRRWPGLARCQLQPARQSQDAGGQPASRIGTRSFRHINQTVTTELRHALAGYLGGHQERN